MTLLDCVGLGINGIIGTGIFLLPAKVFAAAGGLSWLAWFAIGFVCLLVGLCFCEASGRTDKNGGPYLYARDAFGRWVGVAVGWMALAANLFAYGAVARGFGRNLSYLIPPLSRPGPQIALAVAVIAGLAALNYRGIKPGALVGDFFSGAKLIPILLFVGAGLFFVDWHRLGIPPPPGETTFSALKVGGLAALFACTGFEYVPVPAGETDNPRRNVPLALFGGDHPGPSTQVIGIVLLVGGLATVNILGLKPSARTGVFAAAFAGLFACTGFEYVPVPAGETKNATRAVGLAAVLSVIGADRKSVV